MMIVGVGKGVLVGVGGNQTGVKVGVLVGGEMVSVGMNVGEEATGKHPVKMQAIPINNVNRFFWLIIAILVEPYYKLGRGNKHNDSEKKIITKVTRL